MTGPLASTVIHCVTTVPEDLLAAFSAYEQALMDDDVAAMDELFAPGAETLRGDLGGLLVGHRQIHDFRVVRGGAPPRRIAELHVQLLAPDAAVLVAVTAAASGGRGLQTQVWARSPEHAGPGGWAVRTAQVAPPPASFDAKVWRVVGDPLLPGHSDAPADGTGEPVTGEPRTGERRTSAAAQAAPLAGESVAVKDVFAVAGQRLGGGVPQFLAEARVEPSSATAVQRLVGAGASVRGIARTDQLAYSLAGDNPHYGTPVNPVVPGALPGGSSSGSAVAVSLGAASIGLATDTAGSVRVPASYQGLWGLRTTHGSVPTKGLLPLAETFDTVGLLTRDAGLLARAADVLTSGSPQVRLDRPRLLAPTDLSLRDDVAAEFSVWSAGRELSAVDLGDLAEATEAFRVWQAWQAWRNHGDWITRHPGAVTGAAGQRFSIASEVGPDAAERAFGTVTRWRRQLDDLLGDAVLVLPSAPAPAPRVWADAAEVDRLRSATMRMTCIAGLTGRPAVSAPLLSTADGPVGVSFVGPRGTDVDLVGFAAAL